MTESPERAFVRPGKLLLFIFFGLLVYLAAVVMWMPAGWLWARVSPMVSLPPQVSVQQVSGRLWQGAAGLSVGRRPVRVTWLLSPPDFGELGLPLAVSIESSRSRVVGDVFLSWPLTARIDARGTIHVPEFADEIRASGGAMLDGDVVIDRLQVSLTDAGLQSARGLGRWPGGNVTWPMGDQMQNATFPPMQGTLSDLRNGVSLVISEQDTSDPAADASVTLDGMMEIRVYRRMIDLAGQAWSSAAAPGDVVFRVRQPLVSGGGR